MNQRRDPKNLRTDNVLSKPIGLDWMDYLQDMFNYESLESLSVGQCHVCGEVVVVENWLSEDRHDSFDPQADCDGYVSGVQPRCNTLYPVHGWGTGYSLKMIELTDWQVEQFSSLPLMLVWLNGSTGLFLTLTGCGSDMTWDIAAAYMTLGFLPPVYLLPPPKLASEPLTDRKEWILEGCERSARWARGYAERQESRLSDLREWLVNECGDERTQ